MKKLYVLVTALVLAAMLMPACTPTAPDCTKPDVFCVGMVTDVGKIDDKSFNQSAWTGLQQTKTDGVADWVQYIETTDAKDYAKNIATFADAGYDVIVSVGFNLTEATYAAAVAYPDIYFIGVDQDQFAWMFDDDPSTDVTNLAGLIFPEDQSGFLAGALAAMMSETGKVGSVLGTDAVPPVWRYGEGFRAGAQYIDPAVEVYVVYHSDVGFDKTFTDPEWGASTAGTMIDNGADVIFGAGGKTGNGAVTGAAASGAYVIGVDDDQYYTLPEAASRMLTSAMKLITPGVADLIAKAKDAQNGGAAFPAGNVTGDVGLAPYHDTEDIIPAEVKTRMDEITSMLKSGELTTGVTPMKPAE
jgi:basic membrane protein A